MYTRQPNHPPTGRGAAGHRPGCPEEGDPREGGARDREDRRPRAGEAEERSRRYPFLGIPVLGLLLAVLCAVPASADHALITCESRDHRYTFCPADTWGGVEMVDRLSRAACRYGSSWGATRDGIWVDHGCRAEFVAHAGPVADPYGGYDGGYGPPGDPHDHHAYDEILVCESHDQRFRYCPADTRFGVELLEQRSRARCRHGDSWGYDRHGVWVDHGCRAEFLLEKRRGPGRPAHPRPRGHPGGVYHGGHQVGEHSEDGDDDLALVVGGAILAGAVAAVIHGRNQAKNDEARALCHDEVEARIAATEGRVEEVRFETAEAEKPRKGFREVHGTGVFHGAGTRERFTYRCLVELEPGAVRRAEYSL